MSASQRRHDVIVIGASLGGVHALIRLVSNLPSPFPASILVVLHIGAHPSQLPALLSARGRNPAAHAVDGEPLSQGRIVIAPPDHHLLIAGDALRLSRGPKEHFSRPAVDPLFRSAAIECGPRVIGVVLTGALDDGTAGLQAIKRCGGLAIVQDPATAFAPSMPRSALQYVSVDYCMDLETMAEQLLSLAQQPAAHAQHVPRALVHEQAPWTGTVNAMDNLKQFATPSPIVCPECGGGLWEVKEAHPPRFRCHTGHGYSLQSLNYAIHNTTESSLWGAERALQAQAAVLRRMAVELRHTNDEAAASSEERKAAVQERYANELRVLIEQMESP